MTKTPLRKIRWGVMPGLFRCLNADNGAVGGVYVCICRASCLDLVVVLGILLCAGVSIAQLSGAVIVAEILAVGGAINIVFIRTGDCLPCDFRLAVLGRDAHRGLCQRRHQALGVAVCRGYIRSIYDGNRFAAVVVFLAGRCTGIGVARLGR